MKHLITPDDIGYDELYNNTKLINGKIYVLLRKFYKSINDEIVNESMDFEYIFESSTKYEYFKALVYKVQHVVKSVVMMNFYKSRIKTDDNWMGDDFKVFPDYETTDFHSKDWFDYFSDNFFTQISSSFDLIGHVINTVLCLRIKRASFETVINQLDHTRIEELFGINSAEKFKNIKEKILVNVIKSEGYTKYKVIRNDTIHNLTPSFPLVKANTILDKNNKVTSGHVIPVYLKADERMLMINTLSQLLLDTLNLFIIESTVSE